MFEDLIFANDFEKQTFKKYLPLKGKFLHKQIYDILKEANGGQVTYYELSSVLRYDKNLRDTLYIYLATAEEYLKALLLDKFDSDENLPTKSIILKTICMKSTKPKTQKYIINSI